jgi:O-succinylbenzoate synthase
VLDGQEAFLQSLDSDLPTLAHAIRAASDADAPEPVHDSLGVAALLPAGRACLDRARALADLDFRSFKWKVGVGDPGDERAILDDLCATLPGSFTLRLDANGGWSRKVAEKWLEVCADRPIEFVEQPVDPSARGADDLLLGLCADYPVRLALDESVASDKDVERWLSLGWTGVWVVKASLFAHPRVTLERLARARADVVFSSALETAVGAREALLGAFAWKGAPRALGFGVWPLFENPAFDGPHAIPILRRSDVERLDPQTVWNALT